MVNGEFTLVVRKDLQVHLRGIGDAIPFLDTIIYGRSNTLVSFHLNCKLILCGSCLSLN